jgi:hypothetical protein
VKTQNTVTVRLVKGGKTLLNTIKQTTGNTNVSDITREAWRIMLTKIQNSKSYAKHLREEAAIALEDAEVEIQKGRARALVGDAYYPAKVAEYKRVINADTTMSLDERQVRVGIVERQAQKQRALAERKAKEYIMFETGAVVKQGSNSEDEINHRREFLRAKHRKNKMINNRKRFRWMKEHFKSSCSRCTTKPIWSGGCINCEYSGASAKNRAYDKLNLERD